MSEAVAAELPEVEPPKRIGPSRFTLIQRCALQAVWSADKRVQDGLPRSPAARVGTVAHAVLEAAAAGRFSDATVAEFDRQWQNAEKEVETEMVASWRDAHLVPLSKSDRLCGVRRYQVEEAALALVAARSRSGGRDGGTEPPKRGPKTGCELWVESSDGLVGGFIDLVFEAHDGLVIRDYKTGVVTDLDETGEPVIKAGYQDQLRLYAALYEQTHGHWPVRLEVVTPAGEVFEVAADSAECSALLIRASTVLSELEALIEAAGNRLEAQRVLASPSPEVCRACSYRPACVPYLDAAPGNGGGGWPSDVWGAVEETAEAEDGTVAVTVSTVGGGRVRIRALENSVVRHPALADLAEAVVIAAFSLRPRDGSDNFEAGPRTTLYAVTGPEFLAAVGLA